MARHESDREDWLREATALIERVELSVDGEPVPVTAGFRKGGSLSVFFGGEAVYQFNAAGQLRRSFAGGLLYKAERGRLVALRRERTPTEVALVRRELSEQETTEFLSAAHSRLTRLSASLAAGTLKITGQVPDDRDVVNRVRQWLRNMPTALTIAQTPRVN